MSSHRDIEVINKLANAGLHNTKTYENLGIEELIDLNKNVDAWLKRQSFHDLAPLPHYSKLTIDGSSNQRGFTSEARPDSVEWDLRFAEQVPDEIGGGYIQTGFNHGLLHIKRALPISELHSAPGTFSTANYFQLRVGNSQRGWVENGTLPKNTWIRNETEEVETNSPFDMGIRTKQVPVYTDIEDDAHEGFRVAFEWAKFRTMAVATTQYAVEKLKQESQLVPKDNNARQLMRSRSEESLLLIMGFLPDTENENSPAALNPGYLPGVLETTVALELEKSIRPMHGRKPHQTPIHHIDPSPIEIHPKSDGYDAIIPFKVGIYGTKDSKVRDQIQSELRKYFDVTLNKNPSEINVRLYIPGADKVRDAILNGDDNTELHKQTTALNESLTHVSNVMGGWDKQLDTLEAGYAGMVTSAREYHFQGLVQPLMMSTRHTSYNPPKK